MTRSQTNVVSLPEAVGGGYGTFWKFRGRWRIVKGSRRSKKSKTMALWVISSMMQPVYSEANMLVVRKVYSTLHDSCFTELKWAIHRLGVDHLWGIKESPLEMTYKPTGQKIYFRGMDDPLKITSIAVEHGVLCWMWVEEAYEIENETDFDTLVESMLGDCPPGLFKQVTLTFNPWSASTWIKARFFDAPPNPDVLAMTTTYRCNEWLSEDDRRQFEEMKKNNPTRFRVAGDGEWGVDGETVFEEWRDDPAHYKDRLYTHVIDPFEIPADWKIYRGFDFGYARPFSVGWFACDHDGRLYHILELYGCTKTPNTGVKWAPDEIFKEIRRIETEHRWLKGKHINGVADPSIWDASRGESVYETAARNGVYFEPGDNKRIPGWMQIHYRLRFDDNGIPLLYVFNTCKQFIRTMPPLKYDDVKPEDIDTDMEDHIADMTRYVCMARPTNPPAPAVREALPYDPLSTDVKYDRYEFYRTY